MNGYSFLGTQWPLMISHNNRGRCRATTCQGTLPVNRGAHRVIWTYLIPFSRLKQHTTAPQSCPAQITAPLGSDIRRGLDILFLCPGDLVLIIFQMGTQVFRQVLRIELSLEGITQKGTHTIVARHNGESTIFREIKNKIIDGAHHRATSQGRTGLSRSRHID